MTGILLAFGTGQQPFAAAWSFIKSLVVSRKYLLFFVAVLAIMLLNKNELRLESWINVSYDLTPFLSGWEGAWPAWVQSHVPLRRTDRRMLNFSIWSSFNRP